MDYKGKLYGKIGNKYFDTSYTSDDWDRLNNENTELKKQCAINGVVQAKPEKANLDVLAIMGTLVRTLSRIDNLNPELLNETDKKRLLKGKEALTEWCKIDPKDIPRPQ